MDPRERLYEPRCRTPGQPLPRILPPSRLRGAVLFSRARGRRHRWAILAVLAVVLLLLSTLPTPRMPSGGPAGPSPLVPSAPTVTSVGGPAPATTGRSIVVDTRALCLLGAAPGCHPASSTPATDSLAPSGTGTLSSWTNVTPPSGSANPPPRYLSAMTYYPAGHEDLLFGGYGEVGSAPWTFYQDTWAYFRGSWSELIPNTSCTVTTCPSPRAGAMITYDPTDNAVVLFGGYVYSPSITYIAFNDTWLFENGAWTNITTIAGPAPSPRFEGSMVWDSVDNYVLLFGGSSATGTSYGDTWTFDGTWKNISAAETYRPLPRAGAAMAASPSGYIMLFGGAENDVIISDNLTQFRAGLCGPSVVAYWFYAGQWSLMPELPTCIAIAPATSVNGTAPPCGRVNAALGWSPGNHRYVLYGGLGYVNETSCTGLSDIYLNDTWTYANPPGAGYHWFAASDAGDPPARFAMGYATDYSAGYFELFGGYGGQGGGLNDTWRFFELVHARLTGPSTIDTNATFSFNLPFTVTGYGGSGQLNYSYSIVGVRSPSRTLAGTGCLNLTGGYVFTVPYDGVANDYCTPTGSSYNVYRLTVEVVDYLAPTDHASANWTFTVLPPQSAIVYTEYAKYFYAGVDFSNQFTAFLKVDGAPATGVSATLGGAPLTFVQRSSNLFLWDATVNMGAVAPGSTVRVTGYFDGWTVNATYGPRIVPTPSWLGSIFHYTGAAQAVHASGAGPYDRNYTIYENYSWNAAASSTFNVPSPMISGDYGLIPAIEVSFSASSSGSLALGGSLSLTPPSINLGVVSLKLTAAAAVTGKFALTTAGANVTGVQWTSAKATLTVSGDVGGSVPLYGFNILGIQVGFTLKIDVKPSVALTVLLAPTTDTNQEIVSGIQVMISGLVATIALALSVSVVFGIGIASVGIGGTIALALAFHATPTFGLGAGWVNGTVFISVSALFWSDSWNILGPAVIYNWTDPPASGIRPLLNGCPTCYDNGSNSSWTLGSRYYVSAGYDANVWSLNVSEGTAVQDIYPRTEVAAAPAASGAYLFYSNDNATQPVTQGLGISALQLNDSTNALTGVPAPTDPGFVTDRPVAAPGSNGSVLVAWAALPARETSLSTPTAITDLELHGARFYPSNGTWGAVRTFSRGSVVESYRFDNGARGETLVALVAPSFLVGTSTPERLVTIDLATGQELSNVSVAGFSEVVSVRGALDDAVLLTLGGNYTVVGLTSGLAVSVPLTPPPNSHLISERFAQGSPSTLVLIYRDPNASTLLLFDLASGLTVAHLSVGGDATDARAVYGAGTYYVFVATATGIEGWSEAGGSFSNLTTVVEPGLETFGLVQDGASLLVYSLLSNGNLTQPIVALYLAEVGASLTPIAAPVPPPSGSTTSASSSSPDYALYLGIAGAGVALLLAVLAIRGRRRPPASPAPTTEAAEPALPPAGGEGGA